MRIFAKYKCGLRLPVVLLAVLFLSLSVFFSRRKTEKGVYADEETSLRQVLRVQSLYNTQPDKDIVPEITGIIDSMRGVGRNPFYFAATNILIDRLFSDGRYAEADSLAVNMAAEADEVGDSVSMAMAHRVRAQMFFKLSQPSRAMLELDSIEHYISDPYRSSSDFATAASILEWKWIIARQLGDTAEMDRAGRRYAALVDENIRRNLWSDTTGHFPVTALAFKAQDALCDDDHSLARSLLDSASALVHTSLPARAYEHLYEVRCRLRVGEANWEGAIADVDTLISTHKEFPWFYLRDLLLRAEVLNKAGMHEESNRAFSRYIEYHDSLSALMTQKRLQDLTILYRTELDQEHRRSARFKIMAMGIAITLLMILLALSYYNMKREKRRNQLLVKQLRDTDNAAMTERESEDLSLVSRLDLFMAEERPYTDPALGRKELADFLKISQEAIGQLIKNEKKMSVRAYINSFRLEEARRVLGSNSDEGISEMASRLGFGTSRTLQRAFKERYDMSPTQYREAARELNRKP